MKNNLVNQDIKTDKPVPMSYEALKAKCDALAVENAEMRSVIDAVVEVSDNSACTVTVEGSHGQFAELGSKGNG